jgi:hypothetical protein
MQNSPRSFFLVALLGCSGAAFAANPPESTAKFQPIAAGALADINAKDGDAAFNTDYFSSTDLSGPVVTSRLEGNVGGARTIATGLGAGGYSVRWSATLTPKVSGTFPLALRSIGAAELAIDGKVLLRHDAARNDFAMRSVAKAALAANKPYELVVEWRNPTGQGRIAAEWAEPEPLGPAAETATRVELQAGPAAGVVIGASSVRENIAYTLVAQPDGSLLLTEKSSGARALFRPEFAVVHQRPGGETKMDTKGGKYQDSGPVGDTNYVVPSWNKETDFFVEAHPRTRLRATVAVEAGTKLRWIFPEHPDYTLSAEVSLPAGSEPPTLGFHLQAKSPGQFSVGYVGAPEVAAEAADWIWQPLVWTGKRFPNRSYFTKEFQCPIPWVMTGVAGAAVGVGADPAEMPYRMPTITDSRFGVLVRNAAGRAQPMLFAPVLGGPESAMKAGASYAFTLRLLVRQGSWFDTFKHLAESMYGLSDVRENALGSLNTTIDNFLSYLLDERFSYWFPRYKTWGYQNDGGPGAGRQQSAADAVGLALVCDSAELLEKRARPTLEYMLSRNSVSTNFAQGKFMGGHVNNATDLGAAYRLTGGRTTVIRELFAGQAGRADDAKRAPASGRNAIYVARHELTAQLAEYRLTGERAALGRARAAADRYLASRVAMPVADFKDVGSSFWNELAAAYDLLYELYQETGDARYLRAAAAAMREFTAYIYLVPVIPAGDFVAQPGGRYNNQPVPEEIVPAWRVSPNGLTAECAGTAHSHRGVYMASYPSYMARLARDTGETFFRDLARHAIVGRYANYPSYAYRNGFTTVHQKADYPLRPFEEIKKFTSAHYNHPLPMAAFLVDYLVSEAYLRSDGAIDFPSDYTNTGAFFRNKVYGARPGKFHDDTGVYPWLPRGLVKFDSIQVNYVAGHGNGRLYLALANQSAQAVTTTLAIDPRRVALPGAQRARSWLGKERGAEFSVNDGRTTVTIPGKGQVSLAIDGARVTTEVQQAMLDPRVEPLPAGSSVRAETEFATVTATALRFGRDLTSVHVWLKAEPKAVRRMIVAREDGRAVVSEEFPFEVTLPVDDEARSFTSRVTVEHIDGRQVNATVRVRLH